MTCARLDFSAQVQGNQDKLGKIGMGLMLRRGDKLGDRWHEVGPEPIVITGVMYNPIFMAEKPNGFHDWVKFQTEISGVMGPLLFSLVFLGAHLVKLYCLKNSP